MRVFSVKNLENKRVYTSFVYYMLRQSEYFSLDYLYMENGVFPGRQEEIMIQLESLKELKGDIFEFGKYNKKFKAITVHYYSRSEAGAILTQVDTIWDWEYPDMPINLRFFKNNLSWYTSMPSCRTSLLFTSDERVIADLRTIGVRLDET